MTGTPARGAPVREQARAKINLTLKILGRRPDGYHELESLVAFAGVADRVSFTPGASPRVTTTGPFAHAIDGPNLAAAALDLVRSAAPGLVVGSVEIEKNLPVAAGLGGGSADAAAVLRAIRRANPALAPAVDWRAIAARLGADVSVCFEDRAAVMHGIGEIVTPVDGACSLPAVLVNPCAPVPADKTKAVFAALAAPPLQTPAARSCAGPLVFRTADELMDTVRAGKNDLEQPARAVMPVITDVMAALSHLPGAQLTRLSGAGPTAFAVFATSAAADRGAAYLVAHHPDWWIRSTTIGAP